MQCPECGSPISAAATSCVCGWSKQKRAAGTAQHPMHGPCRIGGCTARLDGDDRLCGYHRALQSGNLEKWRAGQQDWREQVFAQFRREHEGDMLGALCEASFDLQSPADRQEHLAQLKKLMKGFGALPYDPRERVAA